MLYGYQRIRTTLGGEYMLLWLTYTGTKDIDVQYGLSVGLETLIQINRTDCKRTPTVESPVKGTHDALNPIEFGKR